MYLLPFSKYGLQKCCTIPNKPDQWMDGHRYFHPTEIKTLQDIDDLNPLYLFLWYFIVKSLFFEDIKCQSVSGFKSTECLYL